MKIVQVFNRYLSLGGEENSVNRIARHLELGGHEVERFWRASDEWVGENAPAKWKQAVLLGNNNAVLNDLQDLHLRFAPDVWILHNVIPVVSLGVYRLAHELKVPIIQWLHNYRPVSLGGSLPDSSSRIYLTECLRGAWRGSRVQTLVLAMHYLRIRFRGDFESVKIWIAVSDAMRDSFEALNWYPERLSMLHHSWDVKDCIRREYNGEDYFLFLGRFIEEKGVRFLVELFSRPEMKVFKLKIAGSGELEQELRSESGDNIEWLGFVTGEAKRSLIRNSAAVLFPSLWKEPLSTVAYEAYEQCRCVITSARGGMSEIVFDGDTGLVLPAGDFKAWSSALCDKTTLDFESMGRRGREWMLSNINARLWNEGFMKIVNEKLPSVSGR